MKATLLKKARKQIRILNSHNQTAMSSDKFCSVVSGKGQKLSKFQTTKGSSTYINFGNARNRHRVEVLEFARSFTNKPWWNVFS